MKNFRFHYFSYLYKFREDKRDRGKVDSLKKERR